jgi:fructose-specific phosphotransferase system IIC component
MTAAREDYRIRREPLYRLKLGCVALPLLLVSVVGLVTCTIKGTQATGPLMVGAFTVLGELLATLFALSLAASIWALAAPPWLERILEHLATRAEFFISVLLLLPPLATLLAWLL